MEKTGDVKPISSIYKNYQLREPTAPIASMCSTHKKAGPIDGCQDGDYNEKCVGLVWRKYVEEDPSRMRERE
jgi:hypothetical protein